VKRMGQPAKPLSLALADLVDSDPYRAGEQLDLTDGFGTNAFADPADRATRIS